jgi:L-aspartate oxidase
MAAQGVDHVWLDLRPVGEQRLLAQFPTILGRCRELGLEPLTGSIPVAPAAHYWMGGIGTDLHAATSVAGLYAVGEVASTGVHGANRLASNSLMECLVFARRLARHLAASLTSGAVAPPPPAVDGPDLAPAGMAAGDTHLQALQQRLRQLCWNAAGVERRGDLMIQALAQVRQQRQALEQWPQLRQLSRLEPGTGLAVGRESKAGLRAQVDLQHRLVLAELLIGAALFRCESRGGHHRTDAPASQPFWQRHTLQQIGRAMATGAVS